MYRIAYCGRDINSTTAFYLTDNFRFVRLWISTAVFLTDDFRYGMGIQVDGDFPLLDVDP